MMLLAQILMAGIAIFNVNRIGVEVESVSSQDIPLTKVLTKITEYQLQQEIKYEMAFRYAAEMGSEDDALPLFQRSLEQFELYDHKVDEQIETAELMLYEFIDEAGEGSKLNEFEHLLEQIEQVEVNHDLWSESAKEVFKLLEDGKLHLAHDLSEGIQIKSLQLEREITDALAEIEQYTGGALDRIVEHERSLIIRIAVVSGVIFLLITIVLMAFIKTIKTAMNSLSEQIVLLGQGNLVERSEGNTFGEFSRLRGSILDTQQYLSEDINRIQRSTEVLVAASTQVAEGSREANCNIEAQAHSFKQISSAMDQVSENAQKVGTNTSNTQLEIQNTTQQLAANLSLIKETGDAIRMLVESIRVSSLAVTEMADNSEQVARVLDVIKGVAEQTNLLALNAAIEAARAGEQGRGFAVVADEVRTLAQRTQKSTSEIEGMIAQFRVGTENAVSSMAESSALGGRGVSLADESIAMVEKIVGSMQLVNDMSVHIAKAAEEQTGVVKNLSHNVAVINEASSENTQLLKDTSVASESLNDVAQALSAIVLKFKV